MNKQDAAADPEGEREAPGRLELFVEPNDESKLDKCDNLTAAPWGG